MYHDLQNSSSIYPQILPLLSTQKSNLYTTWTIKISYSLFIHHLFPRYTIVIHPKFTAL